jgi:hypothetical protein
MNETVDCCETAMTILQTAITDLSDGVSRAAGALASSQRSTRATVTVNELEQRWLASMDRYRSRGRLSTGYRYEFDVFIAEMMRLTQGQPTSDLVPRTLEFANQPDRESLINIPDRPEMAKRLASAWVQASSVDGDDADLLAGCVVVRAFAYNANFPWEPGNCSVVAWIEDPEHAGGANNVLEMAFRDGGASVLDLRLPVRVMLDVHRPQGQFAGRHRTDNGHWVVYAGRGARSREWDVMNPNDRCVDGRTCLQHLRLWLASRNIPLVQDLASEPTNIFGQQFSPPGRLGQE